MRRRIKIECKGEGVMKRRETIIAVFMMLFVLMAGCGKSEDLTGKWVCTDEGISEAIELFSDGTGTFIQDGESYEISRSFGFLGDSTGTFDYELKKDIFTIFSEDGETQNFKRE